MWNRYSSNLFSLRFNSFFLYMGDDTVHVYIYASVTLYIKSRDMVVSKFSCHFALYVKMFWFLDTKQMIVLVILFYSQTNNLTTRKCS